MLQPHEFDEMGWNIVSWPYDCDRLNTPSPRVTEQTKGKSGRRTVPRFKDLALECGVGLRFREGLLNIAAVRIWNKGGPMMAWDPQDGWY